MDYECDHCKDTGRITVRNWGRMSYVCAEEPPEDARGVIGADCDFCNPIARFKEEFEGFEK